MASEIKIMTLREAIKEGGKSLIYKTAVYRARAPDARFRSAKESGFFYEEIRKIYV